MKIVVINTSHRKSGATAKILNEFSNQLKDKNAEVDVFNLSDLDIKFCTGCCSCYKTGRCFLDDDAEMLSQAIANADAVVIGTPCYVGNVSGQLKTFIDRGHFVIEQLLKNKHTFGLVTYENVGGGGAYKTLKFLFTLSGAKTLDKLIVKIEFGEDPIKDSKTKSKIKRKADKLYNSLQRDKVSLIPKAIHFFAFNFGIKPFVAKKGEAYKGVLKHWEERGLIEKDV